MTNNPDAVIIDCPVCDGYGVFVEVGYDEFDEPYDYEDPCYECEGTGELELGDSAAFL